MMEVITRKEAQEKGLIYYYSGKHCKFDHESKRKVANGVCVECCNIQMAANRTKYQKDYYEGNKEKIKAATKVRREKNPEYYKSMETKNRHKRLDAHNAESAEWRKNNPDYYKEYRKDPKNKEKHAGYTSRWKKNNLDKVSEHAAWRRKAARTATPPWVNRDDIKAIFKNRDTIEEKTGVIQHVDHIIPLIHEEICGLNIPFNLQVLPGSENMSKGNRFDSEDRRKQEEYLMQCALELGL
jgi:hypothetical protein